MSKQNTYNSSSFIAFKWLLICVLLCVRTITAETTNEPVVSRDISGFNVYHKTASDAPSAPPSPIPLYAIPEPKTVVLMIDHRLEDKIETSLNRYVSDLEAEGWTVVALVYENGDIWDVRDEIVAVATNDLLPPLDGIVLIGRIPVPRYYSKGPGQPNWNGYFAKSTPPIYMCFYGNLREDHGFSPNGTNLVYHVKPAGVDNWSPDAWVSLIRGHWLPILGGGVENKEDIDIEAAKINAYFDKNHRVRSGETPIYKTGLSVSAFEHLNQAYEYQACLENLTGGEVDVYKQQGLPNVAWTKYYDWAAFSSHGRPDGFLDIATEDFYTKECNIKFVNICACNCGDVDIGQNDMRDCVAQGMVMTTNGDVVATFSGTDFNGGMGGLDYYINSIKASNTIGKAYADWERNAFAGWTSHYGDGEHGYAWPIERFGSVIFGDGTFYYKYGQPPPDDFWFRAIALTNNIVLRWPSPDACGYASQIVHMRHATNDYPATTNDGSLIYQGTNQVYEHTGLTPDQPYYYTIWVTHDGTNFFEPD